MDIKDINKLGKKINEVSLKCCCDIEMLSKKNPDSITIIQSKKSGTELIYFSDYQDRLNISDNIIHRKEMAWGEMIKLIEEFAIKEQNKKKIKRVKHGK